MLDVPEAILDVPEAILDVPEAILRSSRGYTEKFQRLYWFHLIIIPLRGPSCKLRLERFSARLKFQDGPSVAIML